MLTLQIPAISCGHCARAITEAVLELDPAAQVMIDIDRKQASINTSAATAAILARLDDEGYPATAA
ncbi:heavy-metal-associated domain-containing protein [Massilia sp. DWR3-1-1]|uniref:heavy-metal-associated domain-containing protein n=1 Tax=Massilia sp. DWR3-1-1 TaxID=2804559 RepID=UPI003CEF898B